jgi:hypothetical protein
MLLYVSTHDCAAVCAGKLDGFGLEGSKILGRHGHVECLVRQHGKPPNHAHAEGSGQAGAVLT